MSFFDRLESWLSYDFEKYFHNQTSNDIERVLGKDRLTEFDFLTLLSPSAQKFLEPMAQKARSLTLQYFGRTIQLYMPLYIANYCTNECVYCGFQRKNKITRELLTLKEIEENAREIAKTGVKHILFLTGEAPELTPLQYLIDTTHILKKYFSSVSIEIFPMETESYHAMKKAGVDGLTIYQEVYDPVLYDQVHLAGQKKDYQWRLRTPERGAEAGFRAVNIGALMGLGIPAQEAFFTGLHAQYLQNTYPQTEVSLSLPRMNEAEGGFKPIHPVDDKHLVQFILAYRLFLPRAGITISTREGSLMRDNLMPLGVTKLSAGSVTSVGGYTEQGNTPQFEISDNRSVEEMKIAIIKAGYEPVFKDWDQI